MFLSIASALDATPTANALMLLGAATSSSAQWALGTSDVDAQTSSKTDRLFATDRCIAVDFNGSILNEASFVSMDADGFTIDWITASDRRIGYLAFGGSDLTVGVGTFDTGTSTGNQAETGVGFQADLLFLAGVLVNTTVGSAVDYNAFFGCAKSSSSRWVTNWWSVDTADPTDAGRYWETGSCVFRRRAGSTRHDGDLVSIDSDGFTINWTTTATDSRFGYIAIKGLQTALGTFTQETTNTTESITGLAFQPVAVLFATTGQTDADATLDVTSSIFSLGVATSTSQRASAGISAPDGQATTDNARGYNGSACIYHITGGTPGTAGIADLSSFNSDGFTVSWSSVDGSARNELYVAFGAQAAASTGTLLKHPNMAGRMQSLVGGIRG